MLENIFLAIFFMQVIEKNSIFALVSYDKHEFGFAESCFQ